MCDYSIEGHVATRPAKVGDKLVSTEFNMYSKGFTELGVHNCAVCLQPGTEIAFQRDHVVHESSINWFPHSKVNANTARFRQVDTDRADVHHDALEFPNGQIVLLTRLIPGQIATVIQLPVTQHVGGEGSETEPQTEQQPEQAPAETHPTPELVPAA